jgi:hypothetical protein
LFWSFESNDDTLGLGCSISHPADGRLDLWLGPNPCGLNRSAVLNGDEIRVVDCVFPNLDAEYRLVAKAVFVIRSFGDKDGLQYSFADDEKIELHRMSSPGLVHLRGGRSEQEWLFWGLPNRYPISKDAASFCANLDTSNEVGGISLVFEREFSDARQMNEFVGAHPALNVTSKTDSGFNELLDVYHARATFAVPQVVRTAFIKYWKDHFREGYFTVKLDASATGLFECRPTETQRRLFRQHQTNCYRMRESEQETAARRRTK